MYWLRRPPYLRWIAAGLLLVIGLLIEIRPANTELYPFSTADIAPGQPIAEAFVWQEIPAGVLPAWSGEVRGIAALAIPQGEPLPPWVATSITVPDNWWSIPIPLPVSTVPGSSIRVVVANASIVNGIVIEAGVDDGFQNVGMVAFPAKDAPQVAQAAATDALIVMIGASSQVPTPTG